MSFVTQVESEQDSFWEDLLPMLRRGKKLIIITFLVTVAAIYGTLLYLSDKYESEALLLVKIGRENTQVPITVEKGDVFSTGVNKEEINSYVKVLSSREIIEEAIDTLGIERFRAKKPDPQTLFQYLKTYAKSVAGWTKQQLQNFLISMGLKKRLPERAKVIKLLQKSLKVARVRDSNVIGVSIRLLEPVLARDVVATIVDLYQQYHIRMHEKIHVQQVFETQADTYKQQLVELQQKVVSIKDQWHITQPKQQRSELIKNLQQHKHVLEEKLSLEQKLKTEQQELKRQLVDIPLMKKQSEITEQNPSARKIKDKLVEKRIQRAEIIKRYDSKSKIVQLFDDEINELISLLEKEEATQVSGETFLSNPLVDEFNTRIKEINIQLSGMNASMQQDRITISTIENELKMLDKGGNLLALAKLEQQVLEQKYLASAQRREQARVDTDLNLARIANVSVLSPANLAFEPVGPKRLLLMVIGFIVALIGSMGIALLREWLKDTVYEKRDINKLPGIPYLGSLSFVEPAVVQQPWSARISHRAAETVE